MDYNAIIARVKAVLLKPKDTWSVIREESTTVNEIFKNYIVVVAAIPPAAGFIGMIFLGMNFFRGIFWGIVYYIMQLIGVYVASLVVDALAPTFLSRKNSINALKLVTYSMTGAWVASILTIIPGLTSLAFILSLYSIYLLYLGLPHLMECPPDKALGYTIISVVVVFVISIIIFSLVTAITGLSFIAMRY